MTTTQAGYAGPLLVKADRVAGVIQFLNISQGQSQLIGMTIASAVFQNVTFSSSKIVGTKSTLLQTTTPELRIRCINVIVGGINDALVLVIVASALYTLCSCFLTPKKVESRRN